MPRPPAVGVQDLKQGELLVHVVLEARPLLRRVGQVAGGAAVDVGLQQLPRGYLQAAWRQALMRQAYGLQLVASDAAAAAVKPLPRTRQHAST